MSLPVHSSCLRFGDFLTYGKSLWLSKTYDRIALQELWEPYLQSRTILPSPTGRHALHSFLALADLAAGDEVLLASYNFHVVVRIVLQANLVPVFVDIDPETLCMDPDDLRRKITKRSKVDSLVLTCFSERTESGHSLVLMI